MTSRLRKALAAPDSKSRYVRRLFSTIGFSTCQSPRSDQFETGAALEAGDRVRWEVVHYRQTSGDAILISAGAASQTGKNR